MKKLRYNRFISFLLAFLLFVLFVTPITVVSATTASISAEQVTANPGDTVDVKVSLSNNPGIVAATIKVNYDSSVLTLTKVTDAGILGAQSHKPEYTSPYTLSWANDTATTNYTVNGTIATLTFKVGNNAVSGQSYPISLSYNYNNYDIYDKDLNPIQFSITNGSVSINQQEKTLSSISVSNYPNKSTYIIGESLDTTGLRLKLTYSDGSTSYVTSGFTTSGFSSTSAGTKTVTVTYQGKTNTFNVTVISQPVSNAKIIASNVTAKQGDTIDVKVSLSNNPGIVAATIKVNYDSSVLTLTKVTDAGVLGAQSHKPEYTSPYTLAWANDTATTNYTVNGTIATLTFRVGNNAVAGQSYPISLSYNYNNYEIYDKDLNPIQFSITNGSVSINQQEKTLSSISVSNYPNKTTYSIGDSLDTTGLQLKLTYSDGSTSYVTSGFATSGFSSTSAGTKTVTVTYQGKITTFTVTVNNSEDQSIKSMWVYSQPNKQLYLIGETFDTTGLKIGVQYYDGTTAYKTTGFSVSGYNSQKEGQQTLTVSYGGKTATINIRVDADGIFTINFDANGGSNAPSPITYHGSDLFEMPAEMPTRDGYAFCGWADSPTAKYVSFQSGSSVSLNAAYYGDFTVYAIWKTVESVSVSSNPTKTTYNIGDSLSTSGLKLLVSYSDGTTEIISSGFTTSGFSSTTAGTKTVTVTYEGKTTTFNVTVKNKTLTSISVNKQPTKTSYYIGQSLDTAGLELRLNYDDGSTSTATYGFTTGGFSSTTAGTKTVTVTYQGKTTTFNVTVKNKTLTSISVNKQPTKTTYNIGESLDTAGLELRLNYDDGSTSTTTTGYTTSGFSSTTSGTKTVTVTYQGKTTSFNVTVKNKAIISIAVNKLPTKISYYIGQSLDTSGLELKLNYDNGSSSTITSGFTTSGFSSSAAGSKTVTVTYEGKTTSFIVTVIDDQPMEHYYVPIVTPPTCINKGYTTYTCYHCGDSYISDYVNALGHDFDAVITPPTCTKQGYTTNTCKRCGESYIADYVNALGHEWDEGVITKEPTCTEKGIKTYTCKHDSLHTYTEEIPAKGHTFEAVITKPTCTQQGYTTYTCIYCGESYVSDYVDALGHNWDEGVVTKEATLTSTGIITYTCKRDPTHTYTEIIPKLTEVPTTPTQPTNVGVSPGASVEDAEKFITSQKSEEPKGATFGKLKAKAKKVAKNYITLSWAKVSGAKKYIIYANACGTKNKFKKLVTLKASKKAYKVTKVVGKKLKKGTYYKFLIVAANSKNIVISTAKTLHIATTGGKVGNYKGVTTAAKKDKVTLAKKGSKFSLKAKVVAQSKKLRVKKHRAIMFESSNTKIATVSSKGVITAKKKGTCYIYVYAQSGVFKRIKVTVKK